MGPGGLTETDEIKMIPGGGIEPPTLGFPVADHQDRYCTGAASVPQGNGPVPKGVSSDLHHKVSRPSYLH